MQPVAMKVGDLASQTGVSVRTLHYYDEIGLLSPSQRTQTGYRLYTEDDIIRLQQIVSLRQIGFSLEQIRECLEQSQFSPHHVVQLHLSRLKEQMKLQQQLYQRLEAIAAHLEASQTIDLKEFIQLIEVTMMIENYYTPQQLDYLKERRQMLGEERIRQAEAEWQELIAQARSAMQNGIDPTSEAVQELARRSQALIQEFTGGDAGIERSRLPDVPTRRSRSCQSRSDGFSFDGIYEQSQSSSKSTCAMNSRVKIVDYSSEHRLAIRRILERIGWAEQYITASEHNADVFSKNSDIYGVYVGIDRDIVLGFIYVQFHVWNQLAQIQGLAVDPTYHRQGIASALVDRAEAFARLKKARGIYVDTPVSNTKGRSFYEAVGYQCAYIMPRYYEDVLDGVTYQKFFEQNV